MYNFGAVARVVRMTGIDLLTKPLALSADSPYLADVVYAGLLCDNSRILGSLVQQCSKADRAKAFAAVKTAWKEAV